MTTSEIKRFSSFVWPLVGLTIGTVSIIRGFPIGLVFALSIVGAVVALPRRNPFTYWPIGLFIAMLSLYVAYFVLWLTNTSGLTSKLSSGLASVVLLTLVLLAVLRIFLIQKSNLGKLEQTLTPVSAVFLTVVTGFVLFVGVRNYYIHPDAMIGNYLAGGDHGLHIEFVADLIKGSKNLFYSSPFSLQQYSKGIHFLLANLLLLNGTNSTDSVIVQEHLVPALFEYVQLAAFTHLAVLAALRMRVRHQAVQLLLISIATIAFVSIPKLVNHLFWSGFTTSLALSWILLIPAVFPWADYEPRNSISRRLLPVTLWFIYSIGIWIVYQPYIIVPSSIGFALFLRSQFLTRIGQEFISRWKVSRAIYIVLSTVIIAVTSIAPLIIQGKESESLRRLVLFGVSWKISLTLVAVTFLLSVAFCIIGQKSNGRALFLDDVIIDLSMVLGIGFFTIVMMGLAAYVSADFTLLDQPYYVQKMYWILFFVSSIVGLKWLVLIVDRFIDRSTLEYLPTLTCVVLAPLVLSPVLWNSSPRAALDRISIDWFAKDMFVDMSSVVPYRASVFNTWENLGAHVGNIALRRSSPAILPIDIAQSRNSILACWYMRQVNTNIVFTASGQSLDLVRAGCDQYANYVESGVRVGPLILDTPGMVFDKKVRLTSETRGPRFLATGFYEPEEWGTWADGFNSSLQMRPIHDTKQASISFEFRKNLDISTSIFVEVFINGLSKSTTEIKESDRPIAIRIPELKTNDVVSFQFVCRRTYDEVTRIMNDRKLQKCIGIKTFQITDITR